MWTRFVRCLRPVPRRLCVRQCKPRRLERRGERGAQPKLLNRRRESISIRRPVLTTQGRVGYRLLAVPSINGGTDKSHVWALFRSRHRSPNLTGHPRCKIRCQFRANVDEHIRSFPDVDSNGMSGFGGHLRTFLALGVGSSRRRPSEVHEGRHSRTSKTLFDTSHAIVCVGDCYL
jgi:hypothetical protein